MTNPWGPVTVNATPGRVEIAAAGSTALAGAGNLINLTFVLGPGSGIVTLTFTEGVFNEGTPTTTLLNGQLTITALPVVAVSPNSGEILVGGTLNFSTSGGTAPYTYQSSNNAIASFGGTSTLTGVAPGSVTATATDFNGVSDVTNGIIDVRALRLTVGTASGGPGNIVLVPVTITDPVPYAIKSAEFEVTYTEGYLTALGVSQTGTVAATAGWATPAASVGSGVMSVALAGSNSLGGPGVLTYLKFLIDPTGSSTTTGIAPVNAVFNEVYPSINVNGSVSITVPSSINVSPNTSTIVVGDQLQFTIGGTTTPPVVWGVTNSGVATINATGRITATAAGTTRVYATDAAGRTDTTDTISICKLYVNAPAQSVFPTFPTPVPIQPDRSVTGMGIYGYELTLTFNAAQVFVTGVSTSGTASASWGTPVFNTNIPGKVVIVHAGSTPLTGSLPLIKVLFQGTAATNTTLTISKILFNEGDPCALVHNGNLVTGVSDGAPPRLELEQNIPNPFNPRTSIAFRVGDGGLTQLRVYSPDGTLIRTLVRREFPAGSVQRVEWDGTDDAGRRLASGVYFYRLESGGETRTRKMVLLK